jgi:hypothetical protein
MFKICKHVKHVDPLLGNALTRFHGGGFLETKDYVSVDTGVLQAFPWIRVINKHFLGYRYAIQEAVQVRMKSVVVQSRTERDQIRSEMSKFR